MSTVIFDGHDLGTLFVVDHDVARSIPSWTPTTHEVPGRDGTLFGGTHADDTSVTVRLWAIDDTLDARREALRTLAAWLAVDSRRELVLGDEGGLRRMAVPTTMGDVSSLYGADSIDVTFECEPILYGSPASLRLTASERTKTVAVGGTAPTMPAISVTGAAKDSTLGLWRLSVDGTQLLDVTLPASTAAIEADCAARTLRVNGTVEALAMTADWLVLEPGVHTLAMAGSGTCDVTWVERWW